MSCWCLVSARRLHDGVRRGRINSACGGVVGDWMRVRVGCLDEGEGEVWASKCAGGCEGA